MATDIKQPHSNDSYRPASLQAGIATGTFILICMIAALALVIVLFNPGLSAPPAHRLEQAMTGSSNDSHPEVTTYLPAQYVNKATEIEPYVEPF
jgi:hypothetical protein